MSGYQSKLLIVRYKIYKYRKTNHFFQRISRMSTASPEVAKALQIEIQHIEKGTDLKRVAVISRIGMKIASAISDQIDADAETASSSALIELAERLTGSLNHGHLREIVVKADSGFIILQFINQKYMLFGGIENPLRIGFYLEYLRNAAQQFAYILAGNQITEELKHEIEANRNRDRKIQEEMNAPLAENFQMDKNTSEDMEAMKGVLSFLDEWGGEEEADSLKNEQNIIGIDKDLTFDFGDLEPEPISQEAIQQAQNIQTTPTQTAPSAPSEDSILDDLSKLADELAGPSVDSTPTPIDKEEPLDLISRVEKPISIPETQDSKGTEDLTIGIPDDILAALDTIEASGSVSESTVKKPKTKQKTHRYPYGIPLYEGEVPPIPLNDYVNFEIGTLTGQEEEELASQGDQGIITHQVAEVSEQATPQKISSEEFQMKLTENGEPDFNAMASEYDESLDEEEDAMLMALEELNFTDKKVEKVEKKPSKKKSVNDAGNNPFLM